jgi:hypothetical protein
MPILDIAIASYLCGIMVVLGLIITVGLLRQKARKNKEQNE